ncbi:MAG TPA: DUF3077 domain-containing protein [Xanthomonadaceae bacterium]|nr:DUF3077 domain-containing protein [Xanthomonadaceae bacterium]
MAHTAQGAPAPRTTTSLPFERINPAGEMLFAVRPGVQATDALEMASCYMASARDCAEQLARELSEDGHNDRVWAAYYLINMAGRAGCRHRRRL